jgi:hypothetical protein
MMMDADQATDSLYHLQHDQVDQEQPAQQPAASLTDVISPMTTPGTDLLDNVPLHNQATSPDRTTTAPTSSGHELSPKQAMPPRHVRQGKTKEVVVLVKSYYVSHSLRVPALLGSTKPEELETLSATTWYEIQAQLEPLIQRHLFLPKSYLFVPFWCLVTALAWFVCFSIASAKATSNKNNSSNTSDSNSNNQQQYYSDQSDDQNNNNYYDNNYYSSFATQTAAPAAKSNPVSIIFWTSLFFALFYLVWLISSRWMARKNQPVDDELREVCLELSRSKTQSEGYRLEYAKANYDAQDPFRNDLFATRVLRFVPLPIPRRISVPSQKQLHESPPYTSMMEGILRQASSMSGSTTSSEYPTLQSLSSTDFAPFPATDRILENLVSLLFVLVIFQCVNSLP